MICSLLVCQQVHQFGWFLTVGRGLLETGEPDTGEAGCHWVEAANAAPGSAS